MGQALVAIAIGNDDQTVGDSPRHALHRRVQTSNETGLGFVEAPAVDGVQDHGHAGQKRRYATDDAGLGGMRVDNVDLLAEEVLP